MEQTSVFTLVFDVELNNLKNLPVDLKKILKEIDTIIGNANLNITEGITVQVQNIKNAVSLEGITSVFKKVGPFIIGLLTNQFGDQVVEYVRKELLTDLERLKEFETQVITLRRQATAALEDVEKFGERPNAVDENGLPLVKESILGRIDSLNSLLEDVSEVEERLTTIQLRPGIPKQPKLITPVLPLPVPVGPINIGEEPLDIIKPLEEKLQKILEGGNNALEERSQLLPLLENAYASLGGSTSTLITNQGQITDAFSGSTISAVNLAEKGINPLTGKASELGISLEDLFQNAGEGAMIFGYTKEELENFSKTTGDVVGANEHLTDTLSTQNEVLEHGSGILELTDEELLSLGGKYAMLSDKSGNYTDAAKQASTTTAKLTDQNSTYAESQDKVNQSVDVASDAFDNAGTSAEKYGETVEQLQNQGGFFEGIKQGFIDFVESVESNSELMADFFADTLSQMSQNFSDLFFNIITGKFDNLKDLAKQAFEAILRSFLDLVSAIATRQIVISIGGLFGIGKSAQAAGGGSNPADIAQQGAGVVGSGLGLFGSGGAFSTLGQGLGLISPGIGLTGEIGPLGVPIIGELAGPGFLATAGAAITVIGAVLAAAALAFTIISPFLQKTPRLDIDFDSVKTEAGRRAAIVNELLDPDFFKESIAQISVKRSAGLGVGGDEKIKELIQDTLEATIRSVQEIIFQLPSEIAAELNDALLNAEIDIDTVVAGERLLEFDAKGKKIKEKFEAFINGELSAKFLFAIRDFFEGAFESLGVLPENASAFIDDIFQRFQDAGSREARAAIGQEFLASFEALVDAFNIIEGNFGDAVIKEEWDYQMVA